jgi:hypothetical protein
MIRGEALHIRHDRLDVVGMGLECARIEREGERRGVVPNIGFPPGGLDEPQHAIVCVVFLKACSTMPP